MEEVSEAAIGCPDCGFEPSDSDQFCARCGRKLAERCGSCGAVLKKDAAFCHVCGCEAKGVLPSCPGCGHSMASFGYAFCPECGRIVGSRCGRCGAGLAPRWKFCAHCGRKLAGDRVDVSAARFAPPPDADIADEAPRPAAPSEAEDTAAAHNARGQELFDQEKMPEALEHFRRAVEMDPANALYRCNLAATYDELGQQDEALVEYRQALELDPTDVISMLGLGYIYSDREDKEGARRMWQRVIEFAPDSAEAEEARTNLENLDKL